ncbi:MAG: 3-dehydroquinate dehydratase [Clostridia bacterium]|nr:3-dehydroquinate dehydratase [Clostridia bacterium]
MKIVVMNGPNLNLLGIREPDIYGKETYETLTQKIKAHADALGVEVTFVQSNHEGTLVDEIHRAFFEGWDGIVFNPGAYTHTSIALLDAVKATRMPTVEVHISDPDTREDFRRVSYIRTACIATIAGHGTNGYLEALDLLIAHLRAAQES